MSRQLQSSPYLLTLVLAYQRSKTLQEPGVSACLKKREFQIKVNAKGFAQSLSLVSDNDANPILDSDCLLVYEVETCAFVNHCFSMVPLENL